MSGSTRTIWIIALTAVLSLGAGLGLSRLVVSPADAAAEAAPPAAGPITVPVEMRALANDVVLRGDVVYENPVDVVLETGDLGGPAVVTGGVPEVGATLDAGSVLLEVTGRPVILLGGELPVYRTLRMGVSGPDVLQLKAALGALGIPAGDVTSSTYDAATASAVEALYARVGYPAPTADEDARAVLDSARDAVTAAQDGVASAQAALKAAGAGRPASELIALQTAVSTAQAELAERKADCAAPQPAAEDGTVPGPGPECRPSALMQLQGALDAAVAARAEAGAPPNTADARAAVSSAQRGLDEARGQLSDAQQAVVTPLPASEVVYLASLPRRVDAVSTARGATVSGTPVMNVSGATLQIAGSVSKADAALIVAGSPVTISLPSGGEAAGVVASVGAAAPDSADGPDQEETDSSRTRVVVEPTGLTDEQRMELQGANVRLTVPVSATDGEVMAVPTAALTAGPGGEARVEILGEDGESTLLTVRTGLAADGFVEVSAVEGTLAVGDRVVIGVSGTAGDEPGDEPSDEPSDESSEESEG